MKINNNYTNFNNNVQFKGLRNQAKNKYLMEKALNLPYNIGEMVKADGGELTKRRISLLDTLAKRFNARNYYLEPSKQESPTLVKDVFNEIGKVTDSHMYVINHFSDSFQNMFRIFKNAQNDKARLNFAKKINIDVFENKHPNGNTLIPDLLESPFSKQYIKDSKKITSYLSLNKTNKDAVKELDKLYAEKKFDAKVYDKILDDNNIKRSFKFKSTDILNPDTYLANYSKSAEKMMENLNEQFILSEEQLKNGNDKEILEILKTTNKKNLKLRTRILESLYNSYAYNTNPAKNSHITELNKLFNKIDENKDAKKFITKSIPFFKYDTTAKSLNEILDNVPAKKLLIFKNNAWNIISQTKGEERINALNNEITNPFFESNYKLVRKEMNKNYVCFKKGPSAFTKLLMKAVNSFKILQYSLTKGSEPEIIAKTVKTEAKPIIETINSAPIQEAEKVETIIKESTETTKTEPKVNTALNEIISVVKKNLGLKTFERQKDAFSANATKIRLSVLPEIFSSIADTRKADRAVGKKTIRSANKDALTLYLKVNGNNKKYVNYLLKKRNIDNTRMFEVKDIIEMINKAEAKIKKDKELNPNYKARDARKYYNHLYESKIQQYGKLNRKTKIA